MASVDIDTGRIGLTGNELINLATWILEMRRDHLFGADSGRFVFTCAADLECGDVSFELECTEVADSRTLTFEISES